MHELKTLRAQYQSNTIMTNQKKGKNKSKFNDRLNTGEILNDSITAAINTIPTTTQTCVQCMANVHMTLTNHVCSLTDKQNTYIPISSVI